MTTNPGAGHVGPLVPFVNAFHEAGDTVLVAAPASARDTVEAAGLPFPPARRPAEGEKLDAVFGSLAGLAHDEQGVRVMREIFAGRRLGAAARAA